MCIGLWSLEHPDYAVILCSNRDEYLSRPSANAHFHDFGADDSVGNFVLSGRDLQAGGSWFGINRVGRVALLTNISEQGNTSYKASRGHLVSSFLLRNASDAEHFVKLLESEGSTDYAGFNLLLLQPKKGEHGHFAYEGSLITNSGGHGTITQRNLLPEEHRIRGISNGVENLGGPAWPKVRIGTALLDELLYGRQAKLSEEDLVEGLFAILSCKSEPPPANRFQLRASIEIPPLHTSGSLSADAEPDKMHAVYGTRLSTVLLVRRDGQVLFIERDVCGLDDEGKITRGDPRESRVFRFWLDSVGQD